MVKGNKEAVEQLLEDAFARLLTIAQREGVTVKRMRELLSRAQVQAMRGQGMTQQEIMAASGYSLKTIRRLLRSKTEEDNTDLVNRFVGDWSSDAAFPDRLPLNDDGFPSFLDLCARYAGDFTPPSLVQILTSRGLVVVDDGYIALHGKALTPSPGSEMLEFARQSIISLISTLDHNLAGEHPPLVERRLWSHRMPKRAVPLLRDRVNQHIHGFREQILKELDHHETLAFDDDSGGPDAVGIGVYWFELK
ncbi:MAG: hypothetical protein Tsb002_10160 [Wenzhouxiangellaceae bacterium]